MLKKILGTGITLFVILALLIIGPVNFKDPLASLQATNAYGYGYGGGAVIVDDSSTGGGHHGGGGGGILYAPSNVPQTVVSTHLTEPTNPAAPTTPEAPAAPEAAAGNTPTGAEGITGAAITNTEGGNTDVFKALGVALWIVASLLLAFIMVNKYNK